MRKPATASFLTVVLSLIALPVLQTAGQDNELPSAEKVISRFVEVTGGMEKYKSLKTMMQKGTIANPAQGITGNVMVKIKAPDHVKSTAEIPGLLTETSGLTDGVAWSDSSLMGTQILEGKMKDQVLMEADFRRMYDPASVYESLETVGVEEVDGKECYKLKVVKKNGDVQHEYYSVDTGLQTRADMTMHSQMGALDVTANIKEYMEVDGMKLPKKVVQDLGGGNTIELEFTEVKLNPDFESGTFDMPENVKKLLAKQKEKAAAGSDK